MARLIFKNDIRMVNFSPVIEILDERKNYSYDIWVFSLTNNLQYYSNLKKKGYFSQAKIWIPNLFILSPCYTLPNANGKL